MTVWLAVVQVCVAPAARFAYLQLGGFGARLEVRGKAVIARSERLVYVTE